MSLKEYSDKYGLRVVINDMGECRHTREGCIVFHNGWVASIVDNDGEMVYGNGQSEFVKESDKKYSVAMCDYNGYFNWSILNQYGAINGCIYCDNEEEIIRACEIIRNL